MQPFMTNHSLPLCVTGEIRKDGNVCNGIPPSQTPRIRHKPHLCGNRRRRLLVEKIGLLHAIKSVMMA